MFNLLDDCGGARPMLNGVLNPYVPVDNVLIYDWLSELGLLIYLKVFESK